MNTSSYAFASSAATPLLQYPIYHFARAEVIPGVSDKYTSIFAPFLAYWVFSLFFHLLDTLQWPIFERHRIHESEEVKTRNMVTVRQVVLAVFVQQAIQTLLGIVWLEEDDPSVGPFRDHAGDVAWYAGWLGKAAIVALGENRGSEVLKRYGADAASWTYWWGVPIFQFFFAAFVLDTWQYFWHRYFHTNTFLYRHVHSIHHRLYVPYAFGALYNHPLEGFVLDTLGAAIAHSCSFMTMRQGIFFFAVSTAKTVDDHCGFAFPWDPIQHLFGNNADYHDIHHQIAGLKKNFSQPYFIHFDYFLGTRMTRAEFLEAKASRRAKRQPAKEVEGDAATPVAHADHLPLKTE